MGYGVFKKKKVLILLLKKDSMKRTEFMHKRTNNPMFLQLSEMSPTYFMFIFFTLLFILILIFSKTFQILCRSPEFPHNESSSHVCAGISSSDADALLSGSICPPSVPCLAHCGAGPWGEELLSQCGLCSEHPVLSSVLLTGRQGRGREKWTLGSADFWRKRHWAWFSVCDYICI